VRNFYPDFWSQLDVDGGRFRLSWTIPPYNLQTSIWQTAGLAKTTAAFPDNIRVLVLSFNRKGPGPHDIGDFTKKFTYYPTTGKIAPEDSFLSHSTLVFQPNSLGDYSIKYNLRFVGREWDKEDNCNECEVAIWVGTRIPD